MTPGDSLPTDPEALRALLLAERTHHAEERERLTAIIRELQRHRFGRRAERLEHRIGEDVSERLDVMPAHVMRFAENRMDTHENARLTPKGREEMVRGRPRNLGRHL